jgi:hypothetical protein
MTTGECNHYGIVTTKQNVDQDDLTDDDPA